MSPPPAPEQSLKVQCAESQEKNRLQILSAAVPLRLSDSKERRWIKRFGKGNAH